MFQQRIQFILAYKTQKLWQPHSREKLINFSNTEYYEIFADVNV